MDSNSNNSSDDEMTGENQENPNDANEALENEDEKIELKVAATGEMVHNGIPCQYLRFDVPLEFDGEMKLHHLNGLRPEDIILEARRKANPKRDSYGSGGRPTSFGNGGVPGGGGDDDNDPYKNITFDSIGGLEYQVAWLKQCVVKSVKSNNNCDLKKWGITPPKGVLFYGPPGTGKTLLARAFGNEISKEINRSVKFYHIKGGELLSKWFGESSLLIRELFAEATRKKPAILFFDELDGICPNRTENTCEAFNSIVTTLLGQMDTLSAGDVFVFGATNRLDAVDPAMRRPGRFDKHLEFLPPDLEGRQKIIEINTKNWKRCHPTQKELLELGKMTSGYTGADLDKLCRETFFQAFHRHVPNADLHSNINNLEILDVDWECALEKVKPSNSAVYGSCSYIPQAPAKQFLPLISNLHREIIGKLRSFIPRGPEQERSTISDAYDFSVSPRISTFWICDRREPCSNALETIILPGVFANSAFCGLPIYMISKEGIISTPSSGQHTMISGAINQAVDFLKPCVLYLPSIDEIIVDMPYAAQTIFANLTKLCGKPVLVIATASCPPSNLIDKKLQSIFCDDSREFEMRRSKKQEREDFFRSIFTATATTHIKGKCKNPATTEMIKALREIVKITENKPIETLIQMHDFFLGIATKHLPNPDKGPLAKEFFVALKKY